MNEMNSMKETNSIQMSIRRKIEFEFESKKKNLDSCEKEARWEEKDGKHCNCF